MQRNDSCAERIDRHQAGRLRDMGAIADLCEVYDTASLLEALEDAATRELFCEIATGELFADIAAAEALAPLDAEQLGKLDGPTVEELFEDFNVDELRERADQRAGELPLAVSSRTVFRIDLSTGGPADWLEVFCTGDTPCYEPGDNYEVDRIVYHFADWFDHAEQQLDGADFEIAERYAQRVIPELMG